MRRAVIVDPGDRGFFKSEAYEAYCQTLQAMFERVKVRSASIEGEPPGFFVSISKDLAVVDAMNLGDILVFVSIGMRAEAEEIKKLRPDILVIVLTGARVMDSVVYLPKNLVTPELVTNLASI